MAPDAAPAGPGPNEPAGPGPERGSHPGWYRLGQAAQTVLWAMVLLGIVAGLYIGGPLAEFRYVNF